MTKKLMNLYLLQDTLTRYTRLISDGRSKEEGADYMNTLGQSILQLIKAVEGSDN